MDFYAILDQVIAILRQRRRVTYRALKRQFQLDDDALEDLKSELIEGQRLAVDESGQSWSGPVTPAPPPRAASPPASTRTARRWPTRPPYLAEKILTSSSALEGERKQVTVLFADLKGSTELIARPRSRSRPAAPRSGPAPHDGRRAPLRGHGEPGPGRWHHGPVWRPDGP